MSVDKKLSAQAAKKVEKKQPSKVNVTERVKLDSSTLKTFMVDQIHGSMMEKFSYSNVHEVPRILKVVLSMGINKQLDIAKCQNDLTAIAGQYAVRTRAKVSVSQFSVRKGFENGVKVTLRGDRMFYFLERLLNVALLNWRAFPGINPRSTSRVGGQLCLSFGVIDKKIFPEIQESGLKKEGLNVTICTNCKNEEEFKFLIKELGFPLRK